MVNRPSQPYYHLLLERRTELTAAGKVTRREVAHHGLGPAAGGQQPQARTLRPPLSPASCGRGWR